MSRTQHSFLHNRFPSHSLDQNLFLSIHLSIYRSIDAVFSLLSRPIEASMPIPVMEGVKPCCVLAASRSLVGMRYARRGTTGKEEALFHRTTQKAVGTAGGGPGLVLVRRGRIVAPAAQTNSARRGRWINMHTSSTSGKPFWRTGI